MFGFRSHSYTANMKFVILCALCLAIQVQSLCDIDWAEYEDECLFFSRYGRRWLDAENECRKLGAYLTSDDNQGKHEFITSVLSVMHELRRNSYWVGASDYAVEGSWRWIETGYPMNPNFTSWSPGAPSQNYTKNCMLLDWEGNTIQWIDEDCNRGHYWICEKPALPDLNPQRQTTFPVIG